MYVCSYYGNIMYILGETNAKYQNVAMVLVSEELSVSMFGMKERQT